MTIVFDQTEVVQRSFYSGSYGSVLFMPGTNIAGGVTSSFYLRAVIGDKATRVFDSSSLAGRAYLVSAFPNIVNLAPGAVAPVGYPSREGFMPFYQMTCQQEQYYDSVVGHPLSYFQTNGYVGLLIPQSATFIDPVVHTQLNLPAIAASSSVQIIVGTAGATASRNDGQEKFCDSIWNYTGPFQSRYKTVFRQRRPNLISPTTIQATVSQTLSSDEPRTTRLAVTVSCNQIGMITFTSVSAPVNQTPPQVVQFYAEFAVSASTTTYFENPVRAVGALYPTQTPEAQNILFFGFGDGASHFPIGWYNVPGAVVSVSYVPKVRGWKYGVIHPLPYYSKAVYRIGKYGQLRDMLEQRQYSKFHDGTNVLSSPVFVSFKSGTLSYSRSLDYVTATNPDYDTRDTGFYDFEYKSGFGYIDMDRQ